MGEKEKTTVPIPSVGADGEQSLSYVSNEIITAETEEINPIDERDEQNRWMELPANRQMGIERV